MEDTEASERMTDARPMADVQRLRPLPVTNDHGLTTTARRSSRAIVMTGVVALVVVLGVFLRLRQYAFTRPLWLDEAMLAINLASKSFGALARPLSFDQNAPLLFLWLERLAVDVAGPTEQALRFLPLVAGVLTIPGAWWLGRRILGERGALVVAALTALSPYMVYYANEVKPYGVDPLMTIVICGCALLVTDDPASRRRWGLLLGSGILGMLLSLPALFVLAGVGAALLVHPAIRRDRRAVVRLIGVGATWLAFFAVEYVVLLRHGANNRGLQFFFKPMFLDPGPGFRARAVGALWGSVIPLLSGEERWAFPHATAVISLLTILGAALLWRKRGVAIVILLVAPIVAAVAASVLQRYPIMSRTMLFSAPLLFILLAAGAIEVANLAPRRLRGVALAVVALLLLVPSIRGSADALRRPPHLQDIAPIVREYHRAGGGEPVYVGWGAGPAWAYYTTNWATPDTTRLSWFERRGDWLLVPGVSSTAGLTRPALPFLDDATVTHDGRVEMLGAPPAFVRSGGDRPISEWIPETGWAEAEVTRARAIARPTVWFVLVSHADRLAPAKLRAEIKRQGGELSEEWQLPEAAGYRVRF
jgi:hypothetical protein